MKTYAIAPLLLLAAAWAGCVNFNGWHTVRGSGQVVSEARTIGQFERVSVAGGGEITLIQGDEESLTIETDDNLLPLIRSEVVNGTLSIGPREVNLQPASRLHYQLKFKKLSGLSLSGSVQAVAETIQSDRFNFSLSGSGSIHVHRLEAQRLSGHISGSGSSVVAGQVERQEIDISGSGSHQADQLQCAQATAHLSGSGRASLWVSEALKAHISGSGRVDYRGGAQVESHVSGSGRVRRMGQE